MAEVIQANYEQLEEIKAKFGQEAEAAQGMQQNLTKAFKPLEDGGWLGRGADAFFNEMNGELLPAVRRFIEALLKAGQVTGEIAELFHTEEQEAASVVRNGGSGGGKGDGAAGGGAAGGASGGAGGAAGGAAGAGAAGGAGGGAAGGTGGSGAAGGAAGGPGGAGGLGDTGAGGSFGGGGFDPSAGNSSALDDILGDSGFTPANGGSSFDDVFGGKGIDEDLFVPKDFLDGVREAFGLDGNTNGDSPLGAGGLGDDGFGEDGADVGSEPASDSGSGGGSGSGSGGGGSESGGGSGGGGQPEEPAAEEQPAKGSEFSPQESFGGGGFGGGGSAGTAEMASPYSSGGFASSFGSAGGFDLDGDAAPQSEGLRYQSMGGGLFDGGSSKGLASGPALPVTSGGGAAPAEENGNGSGALGIPFGIAAVSPFLALLGKALKKKSDKDDD